MKRKQVEKLINKIDVEGNFESINSKIDYDKYVKTNKKRKLNLFASIMIGLVGAYSIVALAFTIDYYSCKKYNENIYENYIQTFVGDSNQLYKIESKKDYYKFFLNEDSFKVPLIERILDLTTDEWVTYPSFDFVDESIPTNAVPESSVESEDQDSYATNVQVNGIDEADVSKCDGTYIYTFNSHSANLSVFDLNTAKVASVSVFKDNGNPLSVYSELYVKDDNVILSSLNGTYIYVFNGTTLSLIDSFSYDYLVDSRLVDQTLYTISYNYFYINDNEYEFEGETYYDGISYIDREYVITKYDLETNSSSTVKNLNAYSSNLYVSNNNIYIANTTFIHSYRLGIDYDSLDEDLAALCNKNITAISIFDFDLNPIGTIKLSGTILNQFSMDEKDNYLRVVSTDTTMEDTKLNAISIYSLETLQRVGYLNENIGLDRQIVKSVRFENDTCYVVTYENTDPLYEIDLSDVTAPKIVSIYKAPGWSNYLHTFEIDGQQYLFGIGFDDDRITRKISVYKNDEQTTQIGKDFKISYMNVNPDLYIEGRGTLHNLDNHKALFIYNDESNLYIGAQLDYGKYYIFKIDVDGSEVVSIYKEISLQNLNFNDSRCFLVNGYIYVTGYDIVYKQEF